MQRQVIHGLNGKRRRAEGLNGGTGGVPRLLNHPIEGGFEVLSLAGGEEVGETVDGSGGVLEGGREDFSLGGKAGRRIVGEDGGGQRLEGGFVGEDQERFLGAAAREPGLLGGEALNGDALGKGEIGELAGDVAVRLAAVGEEDLVQLGNSDGFGCTGDGRDQQQEKRGSSEDAHRRLAGCGDYRRSQASPAMLWMIGPDTMQGPNSFRT